MIRRGQSGFTLVETLVAVSIFSVLVVTIYASFMSGMSAREKGETIVTLAETAREVVRRLSAELTTCFAYSNGSFAGEPEEIGFVTLQAPAKGGTPRICRVTYCTRDEGDTGLSSLHHGCQPLGGKYQEGDLSGPCIRHLELSYASGGPVGGEIEWSGHWIGTHQHPLPLAVRVRLVLESGDETMKVDKVIRVPVSAGLEESVAKSL
jgi:prepilin-type N-terminal cleavage/methylation domain-containing protein